MFPPLALPRSGMVDSKKSPLSQVRPAPKIIIIECLFYTIKNITIKNT